MIVTGPHKHPQAAARPGQPICHADGEAGLELASLRAREPAAIKKLVHDATPAVNAAVRRFAEDDDDAQDLAQGAWHRILEKLPRLAHDDNPMGWCVIVARNYSKSVLRRRAMEPELMDLDEVGQVADERETPPDSVDRGTAMRAVRASVAALPEQECNAVTLRLLQEFTWAETAEKLGVAVPVARALVDQGLGALRGEQHLLEAYAALAGIPASAVQDDLATSSSRPVLAFLQSAAHRDQTRRAVASRADVFGTVVFADSHRGLKELLRTYPESPVLVDSRTSLAKAGEHEAFVRAVRWDRTHADQGVLLSALVKAIVAKSVKSLIEKIDGRIDPRACQIMTVVLDHTCTPYRVVTLANDLHITTRTLGRRCADMHIPSPKTLISLSRVFMTESMIDWSSRPAQSVAVVLGFSDASSYRRLAKNVLGLSSSSVRKRGGSCYVATVIAETLRTEAWDGH